MIRVSGIVLGLDEGNKELVRCAARMLKVEEQQVLELSLVRRAVDARRGKVCFSCTADVKLKGDEGKALRACAQARKLEQADLSPLIPGGKALVNRPVVVGSGPAGLFAALQLALEGYRPLILERGLPVKERRSKVEEFFGGGSLDTECNVQFGEGGAGTFSDGKLTTRIKDPRCSQVIEWLLEAGAPDELRYVAKPHVGTDKLQLIMPRLRQKIEFLGGTFRFGACVSGLHIQNDQIAGVLLSDGELISASAVILALGHSARDTLVKLKEQGIALAAKPFAMGVRIEHRQDWLDKAQYGPYAGHPALGAADYSLSQQVGNLSVYTFCMCPGGVVVNASSEAGHICVNGMSDHLRDGAQCNSAWVCQVGLDKMDPKDALSGVALQRSLEQAAYHAGINGRVPAQRLEDFLQHKSTVNFGDIHPTVRPGVQGCDLNKVLPVWMSDALKAALPGMDRNLRGFAHPDAVLTAIEARTSSAVRLPREEDGQAVGMEGLYPAGEGAGYAGGIMSSAVDGLEAARCLIQAFARPKEDTPWI